MTRVVREQGSPNGADERGFVLLSVVLSLGLLSWAGLRFLAPPGADVGKRVAEERRLLQELRSDPGETPGETRTRLRLAAAREALR